MTLWVVMAAGVWLLLFSGRNSLRHPERGPVTQCMILTLLLVSKLPLRVRKKRVNGIMLKFKPIRDPYTTSILAISGQMGVLGLSARTGVSKQTPPNRTNHVQDFATLPTCFGEFHMFSCTSISAGTEVRGGKRLVSCPFIDML